MSTDPNPADSRQASQLVAWLSAETGRAARDTGYKFARLAELHCAGFPVPDGFCITRPAFEASILNPCKPQIEGFLARADYDGLREFINRIPLPADFETEILENYRILHRRHPQPVAVRSSSVLEDLAQHSFAGLYETVLGVTDEPGLLEAVRVCWSSYWNREAIAGRQQIGAEGGSNTMAVLVQTMVPAQFSGVMFTQAPAAGEGEAALIEFVPGSGESLVGGDRRGGQIKVDRGSRAILSIAAGQTLPVAALEALIALGLAIEQQQGDPQDIEWCQDWEDHLWIVQTRPITAAVKTSPPIWPAEEAGWERAYDEPFSTLGGDLAVRRHARWIAAINRYQGTRYLAEACVEQGFVYRRTPWRSAGKAGKAWMAGWKLLRWIGADGEYRRYTGTILPAFVRCLDELQGNDLEQHSDARLLAGLRAAIQAYLDYQYDSYAIGVLAVAAAGWLERASRALLGAEAQTELIQLLTGLETITLQRDAALQSLGQSIRAMLSNTELEHLSAGRLTDLCADSPREFGAALGAFENTYGYVWADRYPRDPAWKTNQTAKLLALRHAAGLEPEAEIQAKEKRWEVRRAEAVDRARRKLQANRLLAIRWPIFRGFLRRAERFFPHKENRNHYVYRAVMVIRSYANELGRRMHDRRQLEGAEDIFFLHEEEIEQVLRGEEAVQALASTVAARKAAFAAGRRAVAARAGEPAPGANHGHANAATARLSGEACSPGVACGPARIVHSIGELQMVAAGDVLVCRNLRPAWSTVFARISGLVVEEGGLLSHGATLAREYGVPAVMNVPGIVQTVENGLLIRVDGNRGEVDLNHAAR